MENEDTSNDKPDHPLGVVPPLPLSPGRIENDLAEATPRTPKKGDAANPIHIRDPDLGDWTSKLVWWTRALVGATIVSAVVAGLQWWELQKAGVQTDKTITQLKRQADIMQADQRPWVGVNVVQNDSLLKAGQAFKITAFVKNFGHSPALHITACFASDTPNVHQQDKAGIEVLFDEVDAGCKDPSETVLMPDGQFGFDVTRDGSHMTDTVVTDINRGFATFSVVGRIRYEDSDSAAHWTNFCALYIQSSGVFNVCSTGNEAH